MQRPSEARYAFVVNWYDTAACIIREYQLVYYEADGTIEMYDTKNRRTFLKRCDYPSVKLKDLYKGGIITIYSRQLTIVAYADDFTARSFETKTRSTVGYVMGSALASCGKWFDLASACGLIISELRMLDLGQQAAGLFADSALAASMSSGPCIAMKLVGEDAVSKWASAIGGKTGVAGSADEPAAEREADFLFSKLPLPAPTDVQLSSLLLVRPHAVKEGKLGAIASGLTDSGFVIKGCNMLQLSRPNAYEFFEVYKGVVPEYSDWVDEVVGGKCVAFQVVFPESPANTVPALRELCGAHDPEIAHHLHKTSLRALYGESKVKNAVHCTDLPEDGPLEVDYFFVILPSA